jgi:hypothetical protein
MAILSFGLREIEYQIEPAEAENALTARGAMGLILAWLCL